MSKKADSKRVTKGTRIAAEARAKCNTLTDAERQALTAEAMRRIYHNDAGLKVAGKR